jgi:hypothetical protein
MEEKEVGVSCPPACEDSRGASAVGRRYQTEQ